MPPGPDPAEPVYFDALLTPHRSLGPLGVALVLGALALPSIGMGVLFMSIGAWPVFGFYGLDVLVLYLALRHSGRTGRGYERLRLTPAALTVEKASHTGRRRVWRFQPNWLRVALDEARRPGDRLTLTSHGRGLVIGAFLTPRERIDLAAALQAALRRWREPPHLQGA